MIGAGFLSEAMRPPPVIVASVGTIAVGLIGGRSDLVRGGGKMLAVHLLAAAARSAIGRRTAVQGMSGVIVSVAAGWLAEAVVDLTDREPAPPGAKP